MYVLIKKFMIKHNYDCWFDFCEFLDLFSKYIPNNLCITDTLGKINNNYNIEHPDFVVLLKQISRNIEKLSVTQYDVNTSIQRIVLGLIHKIFNFSIEKIEQRDHSTLISLLDQLYIMIKTLKVHFGIIDDPENLVELFVSNHLNIIFNDSYLVFVLKSYRSFMLLFMILFSSAELFSFDLDKISSRLLDNSQPKIALVSIKSITNVTNSLESETFELFYSWIMNYIQQNSISISIEELYISMDTLSDICKSCKNVNTAILMEWIVDHLLERDISTELTWSLKHLLVDILSKKQETNFYFLDLHSKLPNTRSKYILYEAMIPFVPDCLQEQLYVPEAISSLVHIFYPGTNNESSYNSPLVHVCFNFISTLIDHTINIVPWADILISKVFSNTTMNISLPSSCDMDCCILIETFLRKCLSKHGSILFPQMLSMDHNSIEFLLLLHVGKEFDLCCDPNDRGLQIVLTKALNSGSFDFAILAFSFISNSRKQKKTIPSNFELSWTRDFIKRYWKCQNAQHRQKILSSFQSFILRISKGKMNESTNSWISDWIEFTTYGFYSQISYQWSILSCYCLEFVHQRSEFILQRSILSEYCNRLFPILFSPFEETRRLAMKCLSSSWMNPFDHIMNDKQDFIDKIFSFIITHSMKSIRLDIAQGGTYLLYLMYINCNTMDIAPSCIPKSTEWPIYWLLECIHETVQIREYTQDSYSPMALFFAYRWMRKEFKNSKLKELELLEYIIMFIENSKSCLSQSSPETSNIEYSVDNNDEIIDERYNIIYLWRSVKEACNLFVDIILDMEDIDHDFISEKLDWFRDLILTFRHLGSFLSLVEPMNRITFHLSKIMKPLLFKWIDDFFEHQVRHQNVSTTRRSAGIPFFVHAIVYAMCSNDPHNGLPCTIVDRLINIIIDQYSNPESIIHAFNILKILFKDQKIYSSYLEQRYIFNVLEKCCLNVGFKIGVDWRIRNAATSLFTCLQSRLVSKSFTNCYLTMGQYESKYSRLLEIILQYIDTNNHYLMFPLLNLTSNFIPMEYCHSNDGLNISNLSRNNLRDILLDRSIIGSPILHIRAIASKAFIPLVAMNEVNNIVKRLLDIIKMEICEHDKIKCCNRLHGILLILEGFDLCPEFQKEMLSIDRVLLSDEHCSAQNIFVCKIWFNIRRSELSSYWKDWAYRRIKSNTKENIGQDELIQLAILVILILDRDSFISLIEMGIIMFNRTFNILENNLELIKDSYESIILLSLQCSNDHDYWITFLCNILQYYQSFTSNSIKLEILKRIHGIFIKDDQDLYSGQLSPILQMLSYILDIDSDTGYMLTLMHDLIPWMNRYWINHDHDHHSVDISIHFLSLKYHIIKWMKANHQSDIIDQWYSILLFRLVDGLSDENEIVRNTVSKFFQELYSMDLDDICIVTPGDAYHIIFSKDRWFMEHPELGIHEIENLLSLEYPDLCNHTRYPVGSLVFRKEKMNIYRDFHLNQRSLVDILKKQFPLVSNSILLELHDRIKKISYLGEKEIEKMSNQPIDILLIFSYDLDCSGRIQYLKDLLLLLRMYKELLIFWNNHIELDLSDLMNKLLIL